MVSSHARNPTELTFNFNLKNYLTMALKVKANERLQKIGKYAGAYRYQLMPDLYTALTQDKVIREAALRSGVSQGVMQACWDAAGEVIKAWAQRATAWRCQDLAACDSDSVRRRLPT